MRSEVVTVLSWINEKDRAWCDASRLASIQCLTEYTPANNFEGDQNFKYVLKWYAIYTYL
jgi:hypothetical protein